MNKDSSQEVSEVKLYPVFPTNHMIEEYMLLANIKVAEKIHQENPNNALLRKHMQPKIVEI